ncbi:MAG: hypothetical protein ACLFP4_03825 [Spirochaetales bacterium]
MKLVYLLLSLALLVVSATALAALIATPLWFLAVESREVYAILMISGASVLILRARASRNGTRADNKRK